MPRTPRLSTIGAGDAPSRVALVHSSAVGDRAGPRRYGAAVRLAPLLLPLVLAGCAAPQVEPAARVTDQQAHAAVERVVRLAARQTPAAMRELCTAQRCSGMSSAIAFEPAQAPGADAPPRTVCSLGLPPTAQQAGARVLVLQGTRGDGRPYVTQVLLERVEGEVVAHEPGFWLGIRYTSLHQGRAWSGSSDDPSVRAREDAAALRACTASSEWLAEVTGA